MRLVGEGIGYERWQYTILDLITAPDGVRVGDEAIYYRYLDFQPDPHATTAAVNGAGP